MTVSFPVTEWRDPSREAYRYLLLDGAQVVSPGQLLKGLPLAGGHVRLFDGLLADGSADTSVYLARLVDGVEMRSLLRRLSHGAKYTGCVTLIDTPLSQRELSQRLGRRLDARLPNGKDFLARFYDGRVLPLLSSVLEDTQRADFFALGHAWWYVTPHVTWEAIALVEAEIDPYTPPLELDDTQRRRLMDDAYPYALIDHFALTDPELLERVPPADRYRFFHDCMRMAAGHGIRDASKLVMVCTWALLLGEGFDREAGWQRRLQDLGAGRRTTRQITDEVWPREEETWDE